MNRLRVMEREPISGLPGAKDLRLEFRYDEGGRRVEKTVKDRVSETVLRRERYLYFGWNLVATFEVSGEGESESAALASRYVWRTGNRDTGSMGLLMVAGDHDGSSATARRAYLPGYDGRGNLTSLAENWQGVAAAVFEYAPFGEILRTETTPNLPDPGALGAHFGFATQFTDAESGLVYFGHRYYPPGLGRFLTRDPLKEGGGANLYAYATNDPVNLTDYRGLCPSEPSSGDDRVDSVWESFTARLNSDLGIPVVNVDPLRQIFPDNPTIPTVSDDKKPEQKSDSNTTPDSPDVIENSGEAQGTKWSARFSEVTSAVPGS